MYCSDSWILVHICPLGGDMGRELRSSCLACKGHTKVADV